ncbi:MAG: DUF6428 family protein [Maribacter sp.]|nr:DUF6428 family protein [Maribacter sp.]
MKTYEFLSLLKEHANKRLHFEYKAGHEIGANYHITEVKNVSIDSVDCGAGTDFWKETIIQLWESPLEIENPEYMTTYKALGILSKVDTIKPMEKDVEVKFEYSNPQFHTAQLFVQGFEIKGNTLLMKLGIAQTDCKAKETCGVPAVEAHHNEEACCQPGSGCC